MLRPQRRLGGIVHVPVGVGYFAIGVVWGVCILVRSLGKIHTVNRETSFLLKAGLHFFKGVKT